MNPYIEKLKQQIEEHPPDFGDGNTVLTLLYEAYNEVNRLDDDQIKADFNSLYQAMNGMDLRDMDKIIYPVCTLCRDYEKAGFVAGITVGCLLQSELSEKWKRRTILG